MQSPKVVRIIGSVRRGTKITRLVNTVAGSGSEDISDDEPLTIVAVTLMPHDIKLCDYNFVDSVEELSESELAEDISNGCKTCGYRA